MAGNETPPPFDEFDARLDRLRGAISPSPERGGARGGRAGWGEGIQVGVELVAGLAGGLLLGWAVDAWLASQPLFLIVGFVLGAAAGMLNAYRWLRRYEARSRDAAGGRR